MCLELIHCRFGVAPLVNIFCQKGWEPSVHVSFGDTNDLFNKACGDLAKWFLPLGAGSCCTGGIFITLTVRAPPFSQGMLPFVVYFKLAANGLRGLAVSLGNFVRVMVCRNHELVILGTTDCAKHIPCFAECMCAKFVFPFENVCVDVAKMLVEVPLLQSCFIDTIIAAPVDFIFRGEQIATLPIDGVQVGQ